MASSGAEMLFYERLSGVCAERGSADLTNRIQGEVFTDECVSVVGNLLSSVSPGNGVVSLYFETSPYRTCACWTCDADVMMNWTYTKSYNLNYRLFTMFSN